MTVISSSIQQTSATVTWLPPVNNKNIQFYLVSVSLSGSACFQSTLIICVSMLPVYAYCLLKYALGMRVWKLCIYVCMTCFGSWLFCLVLVLGCFVYFLKYPTKIFLFPVNGGNMTSLFGLNVFAWILIRGSLVGRDVFPSLAGRGGSPSLAECGGLPSLAGCGGSPSLATRGLVEGRLSSSDVADFLLSSDVIVCLPLRDMAYAFTLQRIYNFVLWLSVVRLTAS